MKTKKYGAVQATPGHRAKKSLGQNFLKSESALKAIVESGEINEKDTVLEIGPGKGALTEKLLEKNCTVVAIEKDRDLISILEEKFSEQIKNKKLILIREDILEFDCVRQDLTQYKVIANIPYNITGAIFKKFLTAKNQPDLMVLMIQKEVAQRIIANDGKESLLSISVKAYGNPKMVMKVPARYFSPAPKVDSAVISIKDINKKTFANTSEERFWEVLHAGFAHKRKKLSGNLKKLTLSRHCLDSVVMDKRAENLKIADWIEITDSLN